MGDIEERPSKIRKLELPEDLHGSVVEESSPCLQQNYLEQSTDSGNGENDQANIAIQGPNEEIPPVSKSKLKKLRKAELWESGKEDRRIKRREKHKARQARKAEERATHHVKAENEEIGVPETLPAKDVKRAHRRPIQVPVTFILDCDFNEYMTEKEIISLGAQLTRCYSDNRSTPYRSHMVISSWNGRLRNRFETVLANNHLGWKGVRFSEHDFVSAAEELGELMTGPSGGKLVGALLEKGSGSSETQTMAPQTASAAEAFETQVVKATLMPSNPELQSVERDATSRGDDPTTANITAPKPKPSIVYLSSDSPNTLDRLFPNTSYIIGGIVDKNRHKGICYKRACERGIATAKLPIGEYMTMQSRSVLAVNHVIEIMLKWLETGDWGLSFMSVIPKRKDAKLRARREEEDESEDEAGMAKI